MKKFLIYLVVILVAVSVGFTVFYLVRDNETISISTSNIYMREGETIDDLEILYENKKAFSDYEVFSSNDGIAKYDKDRGTLTAVGGGIATITFRTENEKFRNLSCQVYVGDGTITSPYYIRNAQDLREIGAVSEGSTEPKYGLDKCYKLINNINLAEGYTNTGYWIPIGVGNEKGFTGNFDGNGYTISNININKQEYHNAIKDLPDYTPEIPNHNIYTNAGLFSKIGQNGRVCNLKIENINIDGSYQNGTTLGNVGAVAGENQGTIERVDVVSGFINVTGTNTVGGVAGANNSTEVTLTYKDGSNKTVSEYVRYTARIDRVASNVTIGVKKDYTEGAADGVANIVGGLVGKNHGGIVIYSYAKGDVHLNNSTTYYGGLVGYNSYISFSTKDDKYLYEYAGAHIKDSYTLVRLRKVNAVNSSTIVGGVIGFNIDRAALDLGANAVTDSTPSFVNKVIGNYYLEPSLNYMEETITAVDPNAGNAAERTNFVGCGKYENAGKVKSYADEKYIIQGKNALQLKQQETYLSHEKTERVKNGDEYVVETEEIAWKFDTVWFFVDGANDGYPTLNFANIEVSDELFDISDGLTLTDAFDLASIKLDGHYILTNDIVFNDSDIWVPIGTIDNPFVGSLKAGAYYNSLGEKEHYKIYNIKTSASKVLSEINREDLQYAGLFGVTNGSKGGSIEDLTLVNPIFANGRIAGGIVATNGYVDIVKGRSTTFKGLKVENCHVQGGLIRATEKVGAIAGDNFGNIKYCSASDSKDQNYNTVRKTQVLLYGSKQGYAGGIAGYNSGTIDNSRFLEKSSVSASSGSSASFEVFVGGIAGFNASTISNCIVSNSEGISIDSLKGAVGGAAGTNHGSISNILISTSINASTSKTTYAGGVAGTVLQEASIEKCLVEDTTIRGYYAGGIAGYLNYSKPNYKYDLSVDKDYNHTLDSAAKDTISVTAVKKSVTVTGERVGGLVGTIDNGIVRNCYTQATLRGNSSGSVKGGFAADLNFNKNSKDVGIIVQCYTYCTFKDSGSNYAITQKEILQDPILPDEYLSDDLKRNAGYCFNYAYVSQDGVTDPIYKDGLTNGIGGFLDWIGVGNDLTDGNKVSSVTSLHGKATHLVNRGFNFDTIWKANEGELPSLRSCDSLKKTLDANYERTRTVNYSGNVKVTKNGVPLANGAKVTKGDVLIVTYTTTEKYSLTKFTINGVAITENDYAYTVGDENVTIIYEEKLTHFDVEITPSTEGAISVGAAYIKEGETVTITIVPVTNYVVDEITIVKADGSGNILAVDNKFTMPSCKVTITVTFKQTFELTVPADATIQVGGADLVSGTRVAEGDELTVVPATKDGYVFDEVIVKGADDSDITVTNNKFIMPNQDVTITVKYLRYGTITKAANVQVFSAGTEITDTVLEGELIEFVITPETNYKVDTVTVTTATGVVVVTNNTFVMPNEDVEIIVTYKLTYALTIPTLTSPDEVVVTRNGEVLTSTDRVVAGDELVISYNVSASTTVTAFKVNGADFVSGSTFVVGEADVIITIEIA